MRTRRLKGLSLLAVMALSASLAGCATVPEEPMDPLEPVNRFVFDLNQKLDRNAALPAATYYAETVPSPIRGHVHNVLSNLSQPVTAANYLLQG